MDPGTTNRQMGMLLHNLLSSLQYQFVHPPPRPPSNGHFTSQLEQSDYLANEGWQWQEDIQAWDDCHPLNSAAKVKKTPPDPPQKESTVPCVPHKQALQQPTPGPSGTKWSEVLLHSKQKGIPFLISDFKSSELALPLFVEPSKKDEPPIPGMSQASDSQLPLHENNLTLEPEPEVAPTQSTEDPFGKSQFKLFSHYQPSLTPPSTISSLAHHAPPSFSPLCHSPQCLPQRYLPLPPPSSAKRT
ncbi:hypothetical protein O181_006966 [Austropuccinia psidii MF-1]|uniref:Uncharacterized protein n=1 Tax=Austropuccinia psidii MF-1 TaxID=1389203 RepID=A0A9Q3BJZ9_9BASI|nr:hypothetical protein [Austropuccinia psidii MF-1]